MFSVSRPAGRFVALAGIGFAGFALLAAVAAPAGAQTSAATACPAGAPVVQLANPNPGDVLPTGDIVISGVAYDPAATDGSGISRVDLFLGARDQGGLLLGSEVPAPNTTSINKAFSITASVPSTGNGERDFVAYAISGLNGQETSVSMPVFIGAAPTPTPVVSGATSAPVTFSATIDSTCRSTSAVALPQQSIGNATHASPVLDLANPAPGAVLATGDVVIEGVAFDPAATDGTGIDRVEVFLDSRDSGGLSLGSAVPGENGVANPRAFRITADVPANTSGGHSIVAYAHSSVTGQEAVVTVSDVFFGAAPTPTPRPKS
jgi:hypothetical protein